MSEPIPPQVLALIPASYVERHRIVPLKREEDALRVAHPAGVEPRVLQELAVLLGLRVHSEVRSANELDHLIRSNYGLGAKAIESLVRSDDAAESTSKAVPLDVLRLHTEEVTEGAEDAAIVSFVNDLLLRAQAEGATDIHVEPFESRLRVRFRIDGFLHEVPVPAQVHRYHAAIVSRVKVLSHLDIAEHRLPQDGRIKARVRGEDLDFRISVLPTPHGETVNIRVLSNASILRGLETLGFLKHELKIVRDILERPHGVVLVTGPTGSGKTTTLYSFLSLLNQTERKILTIEDPIEYDLEGITQTQVHPRIGLTFARGLRSMLRHDPDVMMVGEIRDQETAETVIRVALTGHLVFSTVHTNDAPSTPARLLDMGIEPYLVASSVECILAQRLVRLVCEDCKQPDSQPLDPGSIGIPDAALEEIRGRAGDGFARGAGCEECRATGYRGRTAIFEILPVTSAVRDLILERAPATHLMGEARRHGFHPLRWRGFELAASGRTTVEEVLRVTAAHAE